MNFLLLIFFILFCCLEVHAKKIILNCSITDEIENNKPAKKKKYLNKNLTIYYDPQNSWINDLEKNLWMSEFKDDFERTQITFMEDNKNVNFRYQLYFSSEKKNLELESLIIFEKFGGHLSFIKNYYNFSNEIFFASEIQGKCFKN